MEPLEGGEYTIQSYVNALTASKSVLEFEITYKSQEVYWTRIIHKLDFPSIYETVLESGNMSLLPITIMKGVQFHTVLSPSRDSLRNLLGTLKTRFTAVKILSLHSVPLKSKTTLLTQKQLEAFTLVFNQGYYKMPRHVRIEDLVKKLGVKRVAVQERLRRAELRVFTEFVRDIEIIK
ncbi:MAG: helix-turn-helix domain-containing protein [Candidatus Hodarchaeota archaeon]